MATVVPILTLWISSVGSVCPRATPEQIGDACGRRVGVSLGILGEKLVREEPPVRRPRHDVGERAAAVDAELPGAAYCHPSRISPAA